MELHWLPVQGGWDETLRALVRTAKSAGGAVDWTTLTQLAKAQLDARTTGMLDRALQQSLNHAESTAPPNPLKLAVLGASTVDHLLPGIRVGGLRRDLRISTYVPGYGQYLQDLNDPESGLHRFHPGAVLLTLDAWHLLGNVDTGLSAEAATRLVETAVERCIRLWQQIRNAFACRLIHQTPVPVFSGLLGHNEQRLPGSRRALLARLTRRLEEVAGEHGVDVLSMDGLAAEYGLAAWHDDRFWLKAKQEICPAATPMYGDHVARLLAAQQGRSAKCLVLDLDNTLWGGVIGDDGIEGIALGQGSPTGEAFVALQRYARDLARRGVILAVCSKNDEANALLPFGGHPEMVLERSDIACFIANWSDKAHNIREIARRLNIGVDSLVFLDDNPFERNIVRRELPTVAVPELPDDPAGYVRCLAEGGYFESVTITAEDAARSEHYQASARREAIRASATDLDGYLDALDMVLSWAPFDTIGRGRIVQLINKTNQFNLTTRRYSDADVVRAMDDPNCVHLQIRLADRFGDNGIIAIIIGRLIGPATLHIDTWLMSCRVLGRKVEEACLALIVQNSARLGIETVIGEYRPTAKNDMVRDHYAKLGFTPIEPLGEGGEWWSRSVADFEATPVPMRITAAQAGQAQTLEGTVG